MKHARRPTTLLAVLAVLPMPGTVQSGEPQAVTCRIGSDPQQRVFRLHRAEDAAAAGGAAASWRLSMRSVDSGEQWIDLALPGARPVVTATTASLSYRNANGGRQVDLEVTPERSSLDIWVDHGLDVNIEPDLDPRVDRMNTEGPITVVDCTIDRHDAR